MLHIHVDSRREHSYQALVRVQLALLVVVVHFDYEPLVLWNLVLCPPWFPWQGTQNSCKAHRSLTVPGASFGGYTPAPSSFRFTIITILSLFLDRGVSRWTFMSSCHPKVSDVL
jgi:hypothetical protein